MIGFDSALLQRGATSPDALNWVQDGSDWFAHVGPFKLHVRQFPSGWIWEIGTDGAVLWWAFLYGSEPQQAKDAAESHLRMELERCLLILPEEEAR